jgi:hypothetical protein
MIDNKIKAMGGRRGNMLAGNLSGAIKGGASGKNPGVSRVRSGDKMAGKAGRISSATAKTRKR